MYRSLHIQAMLTPCYTIYKVYTVSVRCITPVILNYITENNAFSISLLLLYLLRLLFNK